MKRVVSISLAFLLLVVTVGVTLNKHYCMGRLKSVAIFHAAENCTGGEETDFMPCCQDTSEQIKIEELSKASFEFKCASNLIPLLVINSILLDHVLLASTKGHNKYLSYSPPIMEKDIPVLIQSFLI